MRRLMKRAGRWASNRTTVRDERGAVLVLVAVGMVMLIGFTAFTVDFGRIYSERRELQNGADAAALAVAQDCAFGDCGSSAERYNTAEEYVDANASDALAWVENIDLDLGAQQVTVYNATEDPGGDHFFDMTFAKVIGFDGLTVRADATVVWGALLSVPTLPIIVSDCEWENINAAGNLHPSTIVDPGPLPEADGLTTLFLHSSEGSCDPAPSGQDDAGGFGWLDELSGPCEGLVVVGDWTPGNPGSDVSKDCKAALSSMIGTVQVIPYYDDIQDVGGNLEYRVAGFGGFYVTGFRFPGVSEKSTITGLPACTGNEFCIEGFAVKDWHVSGTGGGTGDFGVVTTWFVG